MWRSISGKRELAVCRGEDFSSANLRIRGRLVLSSNKTANSSRRKQCVVCWAEKRSSRLKSCVFFSTTYVIAMLLKNYRRAFMRHAGGYSMAFRLEGLENFSKWLRKTLLIQPTFLTHKLRLVSKKITLASNWVVQLTLRSCAFCTL